MSKLIYDSAKKIWFHVKKDSDEERTLLRPDLHDHLLNLFQVGEFYYFIFNQVSQTFESVSTKITPVTGLAPNEFTLAYLRHHIHPDDLQTARRFEDTALEFIRQLPPDKRDKYKLRYDFRYQKPDGQYIRVMQQVVTMQCDEDGDVLRSLVCHTDITALKDDNKMSLSFIGMDAEPSYYDVPPIQTGFKVSEELLTPREKEIVCLLASGFTSNQIGKELGITKFTVDTHRKRILKKTHCSSSAELISKAIAEGWI